jgi:hypothetical protein
MVRVYKTAHPLPQCRGLWPPGEPHRQGLENFVLESEVMKFKFGGIQKVKSFVLIKMKRAGYVAQWHSSGLSL